MADISKVTVGSTTYNIKDAAVPAWAKESTKPTYTASEVGALPDTTVIPSAITNSYINQARTGNVMLYTAQSSSSTVTSTGTSGSLTFSSSGVLQVGKAHSEEGTKGSISLSNSGTSNKGYTTIIPTATGAKTISLPAATGTLALTSQIPTVPTNVSAFTNDSGYLTLATLPIYDGTVV